jgi:hypothetical protein
MSFLVTKWEGVVAEPGLYLGTPEERYHDDPCPDPSLSASVAKIAAQKALSKARAAHPRLRLPDYPEDPDSDDGERSPTWYMEVGSAVHSLSLGWGQDPVEVPVPNWRKKDAQELRALLRAERKIPLLTKHYDLAYRMAAKLRPILIDLMGEDFAPEAMACAKDHEHGFWTRSLSDGASTDLRQIVEVKTTQMDASPRAAQRTVNRNNNQFQAAFHLRTLDSLDPEGRGKRRYNWVYQEFAYPYEVCTLHPDPALLSAGDEEVEMAMRLWRRALETGEWPGYPRKSISVGPENFMLRDLEERLLMDEMQEEEMA